MSYSHTQHGRWHYFFLVFSAAILVAAVWLSHRAQGPLLGPLGMPIFNPVMVVAAIFALCGLLFGSLTVRDEGERLALRFGPLPLVRKRIRFADITGVEVGRTRIIDGWGIHYVLGRGWTYNIWGFGCVKLTLGQKVIRVGTDDAENLATVIRAKIGGSPSVQTVASN